MRIMATKEIGLRINESSRQYAPFIHFHDLVDEQKRRTMGNGIQKVGSAVRTVLWVIGHVSTPSDFLLKPSPRWAYKKLSSS